MRSLRLCLVLLAACCGSVGAQPFAATLGVYDDPELTRTSGEMTGVMKEVWVGLRDDPWGGFTGFEFSITGLTPFFWSVTWLGSPTLVVGSIAAPEDTATGTGGVNVAWAHCLTSSAMAIAKLTLFAPVPPQNHVLQVLRHFPSSNPEWRYPFYVLCDQPCFGCIGRVNQGSYVLNPTIAVEPRSWGAVKQLYGSPVRR